MVPSRGCLAKRFDRHTHNTEEGRVLLFSREESTLKTKQQVAGEQRKKNLWCVQEQQVN